MDTPEINTIETTQENTTALQGELAKIKQEINLIKTQQEKSLISLKTEQESHLQTKEQLNKLHAELANKNIETAKPKTIKELIKEAW